MDCTGNCHPSHHHSYCLAGCTDNRHIQPFLHPEKFVRGDTRPDPGCDEKTADMIEQLLGALKSYAKFEQETFTKVTAMRAAVATAGPGDLNKVEVESRSIF